MSKQWKQVELRTARYLGGERIPITGRVRDNTLPDIGKAKHSLEILPDAEGYEQHPNYTKILNGWLFDMYNFEVKHRKTLPKWLVNYQLTLAKKQQIYNFDNCSLQTLEVFRNYWMGYIKRRFRNPFEEVEIFEKLEFPEWILDAKNQAEMFGESKKPVVILHGKNQKIKDSLVIVWFQ